MTKARRKFDGADNRKDFATAVNPKGLKANGSGHGSIALSNELLARGRAVLVDGALPSRSACWARRSVTALPPSTAS